MPQGEYVELHQKRYGKRLDAEEKARKRDAREVRRRAQLARQAGLKGKMFNRQRFKEKATMKKTLREHAERLAKSGRGGAPGDEDDDARVKDGAVPAYLLDREQQTRSKVLSNTIKQKRKEKAGKWSVPVPRVRPIADDEMFKVIKTGKRKKKEWKRMVTKVTFVGDGFTRKPPKYERFVRPQALRFKKAHVTHPELKTTFCLNILGVKKNPQSHLYSQLGVITKGTILEVNVSELGMVTTSGKVVWGKYAQVTNNPENDGCINAVLCV